MIITIEGPDKAGKSSLAKSILSGFWEDKSKLFHWGNKDKEDGWGYLRAFATWIDHPFPCIWDRAWMSENIYGKLLFDSRKFATDPFIAEWFYGRALEGRGGKFIVLPLDVDELTKRRDESDFSEDEVSSVDEYKLYRKYATNWGYGILLNDYKLRTQRENAIIARKSIFVDVHKLPSTEYIGSLDPNFTFVGQSRQIFPFSNMPFFNKSAAEYFRPFGRAAITSFGYATIHCYIKYNKKYPHLFKRVVGVGGMAKHSLPNLPNISNKQEMPTADNVKTFVNDFEVIRKKYYRWYPAIPLARL